MPKVTKLLSPVCRLVLVRSRGLNSPPGPSTAIPTARNLSVARSQADHGSDPLSNPRLARGQLSRLAQRRLGAENRPSRPLPRNGRALRAKRDREERQREDRGGGHRRLAPTPSRTPHTYSTLSRASIAAGSRSECTCTACFREAAARAGRGGAGNAKYHFRAGGHVGKA